LNNYYQHKQQATNPHSEQQQQTNAISPESNSAPQLHKVNQTEQAPKYLSLAIKGIFIEHRKYQIYIHK